MSRLVTADARDGDIVITDGRYSIHPNLPLRVDGVRLVVPLAVTRRLKHPFAYFVDAFRAIADTRPIQAVVFLTDFAGWPAEASRWAYLALSVNYMGQTRAWVAFEEDGMGRTLETVDFDAGDIANPDRHRWAVAWRAHDKEPRRCVAARPDRRYPPAWSRHGTSLVGPNRCLAELDAPSAVAPIDRYFDGTWLPKATFRWPHAHALITNAVLGLARLCLPAYVLYWIIDWLPPLHLWTEYKKIGLVHRLLASISKLPLDRA